MELRFQLSDKVYIQNVNVHMYLKRFISFSIRKIRGTSNGRHRFTYVQFLSIGMQEH